MDRWWREPLGLPLVGTPRLASVRSPEQLPDSSLPANLPADLGLLPV